MSWNVYNASGALRTQESVAFGTPVTSLPTSPTDGQIILFQSASMATTGEVWTLRYRASSSSSYKWEFVGGAPLEAEVDAEQSTTSTTYTDLTTAGPTVTAPLAGDYLVEFGCCAYASAGGIEYSVSFSVGATAADANDRIRLQDSGGSEVQTQFRARRKTVTAASSAITMKYKTNNVGLTGTFSSRYIKLTPIRVG